MRMIELNEAKDCLPQLCESVARTGEAVVIVRDHQPLVTLVPAAKRQVVKPSVWEVRARFEQANGTLTEEFDIPAHRVDESTWPNPLDT